MSYESDERYWTDYLRVALPVVGLLLMLGLLFWWTNSIIGDDQGTEPTATVAVTASNVAQAATNTPAETPEPNLTPATVITNPTTPDDTNNDDGTETAGGEPTEEADDCDGSFTRGDTVELTDDGINFRPAANLEPGEYPQPAAGTQFEITSDCYVLAEDDETRFWRVDLIDSAEGLDDNARGFVAEDFLELVEE